MITIKASVDVRDLERLAENLAPAQIRKILVKTFRVALKPLVTRIKALAPVGETGRLRRSIRSRVRTRGGLEIAIVAARHAHLVEYGHRMVVGKREVGRVPPHPFARPALASVLPNMDREIEKSVNADLTRAV